MGFSCIYTLRILADHRNVPHVSVSTSYFTWSVVLTEYSYVDNFVVSRSTLHLVAIRFRFEIVLVCASDRFITFALLFLFCSNLFAVVKVKSDQGTLFVTDAFIYKLG
jgi:hypothetical protein